MEQQHQITCPLCEGKAIYRQFEGTHTWSCEDCPFVAFEYVFGNDLKNVSEMLTEDIIDEEDK